MDNNKRMNIRFGQIWYKVKKPNQMELFRIHFKNELIQNKIFNERKYEDYCYYFLKDSLTFKNDRELKKYCEKMFNDYLTYMLRPY